MPKRTYDGVANWAEGVNNSVSPDQLPPNAAPRGRNTFLTQLGAVPGQYGAQVGAALMGKRLGALTINSTPVTGTPGIIGGFQFKKKNGTNVELLVSDTGRLDSVDSSGVLTTINAVGFTSGVHYPIFAVANDLCFIVNDVDQKKFNGTTLSNFGMVRPAAPTAAVAAGGAMALDTYDVGLTYYNNTTGNESSLSDFTTVTTAGGNLQINVSWSAPADPQVTHVRVYIRQQSVGANIYKVVAGATPAPASDGFVIGTTATVLNISSAQYSAFITLAPGIHENDPPPSGTQGPVWHQSRLFLFDSGNLYYSNIKNDTPFPEAFNSNNVQPVNPNDGDRIQGLFSAYGRLFIWKRFSLWALDGADPNSWTINLVSSDFGLSSQRSIVSAEGVLYWWGGTQGPVAFNGSSAPVSLGKSYLASTIDATVLNQTGLTSVVGAVDPANQVLMWSVPDFGATRNTRIIPFNYHLGRFSADIWNPFDVYSIWTVEDSNHLLSVHMGGYSGQIFNWWAATNDGAPSNTTTGSVVSATSTTLITPGLFNNYAQCVLADSPISYWRLGEPSGAAAVDLVGGHNGVYTGGIILGQPGALADSDTAVLFDGALGSYIPAAVGTALLTPTAFTWEAWIQNKDLTSKDMMFLSDSVSTNYMRVQTTRQLSVSATIGGVQTTVEDPNTIAPNQWYHVVATYDGVKLSLYKNGVLAAEAFVTGTFNGAVSPFYIGRYGSFTGFEFKGLMDEVAVYSTALSAVQVANHYAVRTATSVIGQTRLAERYVYVLTQNRSSIQRRRITANNSVSLTVTPAWDTNPNSTNTYAIGAIDWQLDTPWMLAPSPFIKKRFEFLLIEAASPDSGAVIDVDLFVSLDDTTPKKTFTFALKSSGDVWDTGRWDVATFAGKSITFAKLRMGTTGRSWRVRFRNVQSNTTVLMHTTTMQSIPMSIKT